MQLPLGDTNPPCVFSPLQSFGLLDKKSLVVKRISARILLPFYCHSVYSHPTADSTPILLLILLPFYSRFYSSPSFLAFLLHFLYSSIFHPASSKTLASFNSSPSSPFLFPYLLLPLLLFPSVSLSIAISPGHLLSTKGPTGFLVRTRLQRRSSSLRFLHA